LSEICSQLKRDDVSATNPYKDYRGVKRSGSQSKQYSGQNMRHKVQHLMISMARFKQQFLRRDYLIVALVKNMTESNYEKVNRKLFDSTEDKSGLKEDIKELQKFNSTLSDKLELSRSHLEANKERKLSKTKYWKTSNDLPDTHKKCRGQSKTSDMLQWEAEKAQLNSAIRVLSNELKRTNEIPHDNEYTIQLKEASNCINNFLTAMQNLQTALLKQDEYTTKQLQNNFELHKAQLISLANDLNRFEIKAGKKKPGMRSRSTEELFLERGISRSRSIRTPLDLMPKLRRIVKEVKDKIMEAMRGVDYKVLLQKQQIEIMQMMIKERLSLGIRGRRQEHMARSNKIFELHKRILHIKHSMEEEQKSLETENTYLKRKIAEMTSNSMQGQVNINKDLKGEEKAAKMKWIKSSIDTIADKILNSLNNRLRSLIVAHNRLKTYKEQIMKIVKNKNNLIKRLEIDINKVKTQTKNEIENLNAKLLEKDTLVQEASKIIENLNLKTHKQLVTYNESEKVKEIEILKEELVKKEKILQDTRKVIMNLNTQLNDTQAQYKKLIETNKHLLTQLNDQKKKPSALNKLMITNTVIKETKERILNKLVIQEKKLMALNKIVKRLVDNKGSLNSKLVRLKRKAEEIAINAWVPIQNKVAEHKIILEFSINTVYKLIKHYNQLKNYTIVQTKGNSSTKVLNTVKKIYEKSISNLINLKETFNCCISLKEAKINSLTQRVNTHKTKNLFIVQNVQRVLVNKVEQTKNNVKRALFEQMTNINIRSKLLNGNIVKLEEMLKAKNEIIKELVEERDKELKKSRSNSGNRQQTTDILQEELKSQEKNYRNNIHRFEVTLKEYKKIIKTLKANLKGFTGYSKNELVQVKDQIIKSTRYFNMSFMNIYNKLKDIKSNDKNESKNLMKHLIEVMHKKFKAHITSIEDKVMQYNNIDTIKQLLIHIKKYRSSKQYIKDMNEVKKVLYNIQMSFFNSFNTKLKEKFNLLQLLKEKLITVKLKCANKDSSTEVMQLSNHTAEVINRLQEKVEEVKLHKQRLVHIKEELINFKQNSLIQLNNLKQHLNIIKDKIKLYHKELITECVILKERSMKSHTNIERVGKDTLLMQQMSEKLFKLQSEKDVLEEELEKKCEELIKLQADCSTVKAKQERINELEKRSIDYLTKINSLNSELISERAKLEKSQQKDAISSKELRRLLEEKEKVYNTLLISHNHLKSKYANKTEEEKIIIEKFTTLIKTNIEVIIKRYNMMVSGLETRLLGLSKVKLKADHLTDNSQILVMVNYLREHIDDILITKHKELTNVFNLSLDKTLKAKARILSKARQLIQPEQSASTTVSAFTESSNSLYKALAKKNAKLMKELAEQKQATNELTTKVLTYQAMVEDVKSNSESPSRTAYSPIKGFTKQLIKDSEGSLQRDTSPANSVKTCPVPGRRLKEEEELETHVANHIKMLAIQCLEKIPLK